MDLISVIITTHNRLNLLKRAICSVLCQSYKNIEIIVVDDASEDDTKSYCSTIPVRYIKIPKNESHGGNYARNVGIRASMGSYIAFLDDDDYWRFDKIDKQMTLVKEKNCRFVYCGCINEVCNNNVVKKVDIKLPLNFNTTNLKEIILTEIITTTSCMLVEKNLLEEVGLFDEKIGFWQEYELLIRIANVSECYYVNEPLVYYTINIMDTQRLTNKYYPWLEAVHYIYDKHKEHYDNLSFRYSVATKTMFLLDASHRCENAGLKSLSIKYKLKAFPLRCIRKMFSCIDKF